MAKRKGKESLHDLGFVLNSLPKRLLNKSRGDFSY